jgi:predicted Rossmann fold nucleotide-binding protein DprA/Smf involved in DNA uptake
MRVVAESADRAIGVQRIDYLLGRSGALAVATERWERAGLWVIVRSDADYPRRLKERLGPDSPPFFFGAGDRGLLSRGGVAIVGSRNASDSDLDVASRMGREAAEQGFSVVSGGARGADDAAILGALGGGGTALGIVPGDLLRLSTSPKYRDALVAANLTLLSPFNPEAGFAVGTAMARNKYIYCLADAAIVIAVDKGKGGTWSGAVENLRRNWVPLWVRTRQGENSGGEALMQRGAFQLPSGPLQIALMIAPVKQGSVGAQQALEDGQPSAIASNGASASLGATPRPVVGSPSVAESSGVTPPSIEAYASFLRRFRELPAKPATSKELARLMAMKPREFYRFLATAVRERRVKKLRAPTRYKWIGDSTAQASLFDVTPLTEPRR